MFCVVLFELLRIQAMLLVDFCSRDSLAVVWVVGFVSVLRTVFNEMAFNLTTPADVARSKDFVLLIAANSDLLIHLLHHLLKHNLVIFGFGKRICFHLIYY